MTKWILLLALALTLSTPAEAQLGLPEVPAVGGVVGRAGETVENAAEAIPLRDLRRLQVRDLLRRHRRALEADPQGEPIIRSQILALGMSAEAETQARVNGFEIVARQMLGEGIELVTMRAPSGMTTARALQRLRAADPDGVFDFDHLYLQSGQAGRARDPPSPRARRDSGVRIGMIDSAPAEHPAITGAIALERAFAGVAPTPDAHGTAVASLLLEAAPGARLVAADIYGGAPTGGASSALVRALAWLEQEDVRVINVSLVGPRNRIVEAMVARSIAGGRIIVAAVGNDGPAAAPLFPAAYEGVVGVTGVDAAGRVLREAGRGAQVDFAAPGIVAAAAPHGRVARVRGTSFAAPIVAGLIAVQVRETRSADRAIASLRSLARDAGAPGRDDVYGFGVVELDR